jgi:hypothetical protein
MVKVCLECSTEIENGRSKLCSDDCRLARASNRNKSLTARFAVLERTLRDEQIFWRDDRLIQSINFFAALLEFGCTYCGTPLDSFTGHCLDRIDNTRNHNSWNVAACCPSCNRLKSNEFSFEEMALIGSAVRQIRAIRINNNKNIDLCFSERSRKAAASQGPMVGLPTRKEVMDDRPYT